MTKSIQQPKRQNLPVENKDNIIQAEIDHILSSDFFIETERDEELHDWLDRQRKSKQCGLILEDKGSNLSQSCYEYSCSLASQKGSLLSIPLKVLYVKTSLPGGALEPIRLCAVCYGDLPYHRLEWQFKSTAGCDLHRLRLLSKCPSCGEHFPVPADWVEGRCNKCGMKYSSMAKKQKSY